MKRARPEIPAIPREPWTVAELTAMLNRTTVKRPKAPPPPVTTKPIDIDMLCVLDFNDLLDSHVRDDGRFVKLADAFNARFGLAVNATRPWSTSE